MPHFVPYSAEFLSVTLSSSSTIEHVIRIVSYMMLAFLVREATWRLQKQSFIAALPLVVVGFLEGSLWVQHFVNGPEFFVSDTYGHHSHYALLNVASVPPTVDDLPREAGHDGVFRTWG